MSDMLSREPLTANFHFIKNCNFKCSYCFATFADLTSERPRLRDAQLLDLAAILGRRYSKVTFVGGEPTLYPRLPALLAMAKSEGAFTNIVTNGSRIDAEWLEANVRHLDFLTLSIDSDDPEKHRALGRTDRAGRTVPTNAYVALAEAARSLGIGVKLNTVVTTLTAADSLSALVQRIRPERWKILQAAPVEGQNDGRIEELTPDRQAFDEYVSRHEVALAGSGIRIVPEPIDLLRGSYIMVDPEGRFFDSVEGRHRYSAPILDVGIDAAFAQVSFDTARFLERSGDADFTGR